MVRDPVARSLRLSTLLLAVGCANAPQPAQQRTTPHQPSNHARSAFAWHYRARFDARGELFIEARFDGKTDEQFAIDDELAPFVRQLEVADGDRWLAAAKRETSWSLRCAAGCSIRYRFALREACERVARADTAIAAGEVLISPPSTWLLHPTIEQKDAIFELAVEPGPGARFVSAFEPISGTQPDRYHAPLGALDDASFAAFGPLHVVEIPAGDTKLQLGVATDGLQLSAAQVEAWITTSAEAVAHDYQGHLPARRTLILVMQGRGDSTRGITLGGGGPGVLIRAAEGLTPTTTRDDWVVAHELLHANFPDVGPAHGWLSEGLATYLEPIIRARVGLVEEAKVWRDMIDGMPQGLPGVGDEGLENTRTWGRTYWGGALFCLLADVEIREQTGNQRSLDDVLLAIGKTGDSDEDFWPIEHVLEEAERATSTQVLRELFDRLGKHPGTVDLNQLFTRLGVQVRGRSLVFDEQAPLAKVRQAITARRPE